MEINCYNEDLHGKHFVYFLQKYGKPDSRVILWNALLGYELCYWDAEGGGTLCFAFDPDNRCVALSMREFTERYVMPRVYYKM